VADPALIDRLRHAAEPLFRQHGVLAAYAYGSRVSGRPRPASDLDVGYYLAPPRLNEPLPLDVELRLASALSDAVGVDVDLRSLGSAPLELKGRVLEEGVRIYSGEPAARVALERDLLARYHDYKDVFREMHEIRLKRAARRS
jgi:predicted nucleotidyltransferase